MARAWRRTGLVTYLVRHEVESTRGKLPLPSDHPATRGWEIDCSVLTQTIQLRLKTSHLAADGTFGKELRKLLKERKVTLLFYSGSTRSETYCCNLSVVRYKLRCQQALISRPAGAVRELSIIGKLVGAFQPVVFLFSLLIHLPGREYSGYG